MNLNWNRIKFLTQEEPRRAGADVWTEKEVLYTDLVWSPRGDEVHFLCEELPKRDFISVRGSGYFHAIYKPHEEVFIHIDGALRFYSDDEWDIRKNAHVKDVGKLGKRVKILDWMVCFQKEYLRTYYQHFYLEP